MRFFKLTFIGICAISFLMQTRLLLGLSASPGFLDGLVFGGAIFGYHFTHPIRHLRATAWAAGVLGAVCGVFWAYNGGTVLGITIPVLLWMAYYGFQWPGNAGLRSRLWAKPLTVALAWAWITVFLPLPVAQWSGELVMFLERGAFVFALAIAYDVSDITYDRALKLSTLAQRLDGKGTFLLIYIALAVSGIFVSVAYTTGAYNLKTTFLLLFSLVFSGWWLRYLLQNNRLPPWQKILIDALVLLQGALVLLLR